jgi:hypothetical protein
MAITVPPAPAVVCDGPVQPVRLLVCGKRASGCASGFPTNVTERVSGEVTRVFIDEKIIGFLYFSSFFAGKHPMWQREFRFHC